MKKNELEEAYMEDFQRGEKEAFRKIYHLHYKPLCYFAYNLLLNKELAEQVAHRNLVKIYGFRKIFSNASILKSFLFVSTRNNCLDYIREDPSVGLPWKETEYEFEPDYKRIEEERVNAFIMQEVFQQIEELPSQSNEIFKLMFFQGKSTTDIANQLKISQHTVRRKKKKAVELLKADLLKRNLLMAFPV